MQKEEISYFIIPTSHFHRAALAQLTLSLPLSRPVGLPIYVAPLPTGSIPAAQCQLGTSRLR